MKRTLWELVSVLPIPAIPAFLSVAIIRLSVVLLLLFSLLLVELLLLMLMLILIPSILQRNAQRYAAFSFVLSEIL